MDLIKPWYLSKTIWASIVTVAAAAAGMFGIPVEDVDHDLLADTILQAVAVLGGLTAIFGRLSASTRIK